MDLCKQLGRGIAVSVLLTLGGLALLLGGCYASYVALQNRVMRQDQFLAVNKAAPWSVPVMTPTPTSTPTAPPLPTPTLTPTPTRTPTPTPVPKPIRISIPAIGVDSSIASVSLVTDPGTGLASWDVESLFRPGRRDLVGHMEGTALPGEGSNAVLGGHNYGYGYNGVFFKLGQLKIGDRITVVNQMGETWTYQVVSVERVKWQRQTLDELARHLEYMAPTPQERLTLVTCSGTNIAPFPERIYVIAEPADQ
jgi:LPXTG-site transpeptidase (sortase) family protein